MNVEESIREMKIRAKYAENARDRHERNECSCDDPTECVQLSYQQSGMAYAYRMSIKIVEASKS